MRRIFILLVAVGLVLVFTFIIQRNAQEKAGRSGPEDLVEKTLDKQDKPGPFPGFASLEEAADPKAWAPYFPREFKYWQATEEMRMTTYGGGGRKEAEAMEIEKMNYLETYPFLKVNYAGFSFEKGYYRSRGHIHALTDVLDTKRLPDWDQRPAACMACKSSDVVADVNRYGDDYFKKPFAEVVGKNTIGCLDCHDHQDASVKIHREWLVEALAHNSFKNIKPEGRKDLTCAQCHVNYYFDAVTRKPVLPWSVGLSVENQLEDYSLARRSDEWEHAITGALVAKIQHPEYELYHEGQNVSVHAEMGLGCVDCHMPVKKDEQGREYRSHTWTSPLIHVEESCLMCHDDWGRDEIIRQAEAIQKEVYEKQNHIGAELARYIILLGEEMTKGTLSEDALKQARGIQREAQFYWDFIWVENSNGFHNWEEAHRVLDKAEKLIGQGLALVRPY